MPELLRWDADLFVLLNSTLTHPWLDWFFPAITDLHKTLMFRILVPLLMFFALARAWGPKRGAGLFAGLLLTLALTDAVSTHAFKKTIQRPRPPQTPGLTVVQRSPAGSFSFPSNHAVNSFAFATFATAFLAGTGPWLFVIAFLVAYSRIYNGVHFPLDVTGGALLGVALAMLTVRLARRLVLRGRLPSGAR